MYQELNQKYTGDWTHIVNEVKIRRVLLSEKDRVGIGTFQPKDEKNQDATELTGDINYRKIAIYGSDSDPRAFNFDGEFNIANRGLIEFVEVLKLEVAFLYDLLGASQEHKIKPKKFAQTDIDEVIIGHTNEPEYRKLQNNEYMEALRDRTVRIDVPYICRLHDEMRIYERDYNTQTIPGIHIAPHTLEMAAMWAVLTRLEVNSKLTLVQKLKLYDGKHIPGFSGTQVNELQAEAQREGMEGISPRYVQDKISNALVIHHAEGCINPWLVLNELETGLRHASLISNESLQRRYGELIATVRQEYEAIIQSEVQQAIAADTEALNRLCANYIDQISIYTQQPAPTGAFSGSAPDERLMRSIEEKIDIPESRKDDFRGEMMHYLQALARDQKFFDFRSNERLRRALELKLFEDQKDLIRLSIRVPASGDGASREKIQAVNARLIQNFGYCEICAAEVLDYVTNVIFRGERRPNP
jgi:serine protein kinase